MEENRARGAADRELELVDTGVFAENRYFDVVVEYAKASTDDVLMLITAHNRGPDAATLHVLPQLWARNVWSWDQGVPRPQIRLDPDHGGSQRVLASHPALARTRVCEVDGAASWLFCENETNVNRLFGAQQPGPFKDGINDHVVDGVYDAVNPLRRGTKSAAHLRLHIAARGSATVRLRPESSENAFAWFDAVMDSRRSDCDAFYAAVQRGMPDPDARLVQRQALAGMLWSKQFYMLDVRRWLDGDPAQPAPPPGRSRNADSNWRGPVWMPINILLIDSLREFHRYYGDDFRVECPTGSGVYCSLEQVAEMLSQRLTGLFLKGPDGRRALHGDDELSQTDLHFRDNILFHEYFHGDTGRGLGASHQTGWTGCVALLLSPEHGPWWQSSVGLPGAKRP